MYQIIQHESKAPCPYESARRYVSRIYMTFAILNLYSAEKRYTCVDATCRDRPELPFYQTWTALQQHIRTTHPPTCPHDECAGRMFSAQKGLRAHLRLHEQRAIEEHEHMSSEDEDEALPRKRRRGGEVGRDWKCEVDGCTKDFKSVRHIDFSWSFLTRRFS
jgi:general transcription factor IIIA